MRRSLSLFAMVLAYYNVKNPLEKLRIETGVSRDGGKRKEYYGCQEKVRHGSFYGYRKGLKELFALKPPCILH